MMQRTPKANFTCKLFCAGLLTLLVSLLCIGLSYLYACPSDPNWLNWYLYVNGIVHFVYGLWRLCAKNDATHMRTIILWCILEVFLLAWAGYGAYLYYASMYTESVCLQYLYLRDVVLVAVIVGGIRGVIRLLSACRGWFHEDNYDCRAYFVDQVPYCFCCCCMDLGALRASWNNPTAAPAANAAEPAAPGAVPANGAAAAAGAVPGPPLPARPAQRAALAV